MTLQGYWADHKSADLRHLPDDLVVVLPLGATEQHGPHLPLNVDTILTDAVLAKALSLLDPGQNVLVLPTLTITKSDEHLAFPGTLAVSAETLLAMLRDTATALAQSGVTRCVIFNGHGGNTALLEIAGRDMRKTHGMAVVQCSWFGFADYDTHFDTDEIRHDIHAGDIETSAMLAVRPDLVDMTQAQNFTPAQAGWEQDFPQIGLNGQPARPAWLAQDLHPLGACGNAAAAQAGKGAHLMDTAARGVAAFLKSFARFDLANGGSA